MGFAVEHRVQERETHIFMIPLVAAYAVGYPSSSSPQRAPCGLWAS